MYTSPKRHHQVPNRDVLDEFHQHSDVASRSQWCLKLRDWHVFVAPSVVVRFPDKV
jgi:hypothetical protein